MNNNSPFNVIEYTNSRDAYFSITFRLDEKEYTPSAIELSLLLLIEDGKVFASRKDMSDKCAALYGMTYSSSFSHSDGSYFVTFTVSVVDDAYIKTFRNLRFEAIKLLQKVLTSGIKNTPETFARLRNDLVLQNEDIMSNPSFTLLAGLRQSLGKEFTLGELRFGTNKEIMETTLSDINKVLEAYKTTAYSGVYLGRTANNIKDKISSLFKFYETLECPENKDLEKDNIGEEEGTTDFPQSLLAMVYKNFNYTDEKTFVIGTMIQTILSNTATSRLFENIRERLHLVYDISSIDYYKLGIQIIKAPLKNINKSITMTNVKKIMEDAIANGVREEELNNAKEQMISAFKSVSNNSGAKQEFILGMLRLGYSINEEDYINITKEITLDEVNEKLKSFSYIGSYFVKGSGE